MHSHNAVCLVENPVVWVAMLNTLSVKPGNFMANYTYGVSLVITNTAIAISAVGYGSEFLGATPFSTFYRIMDNLHSLVCDYS